MYRIIRSLLFLLSAEQAHHLSFFLLRIFLSIPGVGHLVRSIVLRGVRSVPVEAFGLRFPNAVGLAAGFDKNALLGEKWYYLGFGFIEVGTATPLAQTGNPKPRLFRLLRDEAIQNRMGFNNDGAQAIAQRLRTRRLPIIIGGNIGKNKNTPNEQAVEDYLTCYDALASVCDFITVNVSSPNTPGLRALQDRDPLLAMLTALVKRRNQSENKRPILLKIAPDLTEEMLDDVVDVVMLSGVDGLIATNTTLDYSLLQNSEAEARENGAGGISGKPLRAKSDEVIKYLHQRLPAGFPIVGVGGIMNGNDAVSKREAGAKLVQVYSGYVYRGPALLREILKKLN